MDGKEPSKDGCPVHQGPCPLVEEVETLREEVRRLRELSQKDPLTGLFNFRYLVESLDEEMERTRRTGLPTSLIICDLDRFKRVNDTHGHETGNQALIHVGVIWHRLLRRLDTLCRYGGEEFAVVLPGTRLGQAAVVAERLRATLVENPVRFGGETIPLTSSFGVDCYLGAGNLTPRGFLDRGDRWLLKAKKAGRNRVCWDETRLAAVPTEVSPEERGALMTKPFGKD